MKILILIDGMGIGGAETHVLTLAEALIKEGEQVDVMCAGGAYTQALVRAGANVFIAPLKERGARSILHSMRSLRRCRHRGYTVIHAHTRYTAALANLCLPHIPLVTTAHLNFSLTPLKRTLACWGKKTLAVSTDLERYLQNEYGVKKEDILLTKNGVDPLVFSPIAMRGKWILHISRLDKDRSRTAHLLCSIAPALHKRYPDRKIRIIGDGEDLDSLKKEAAQANEISGATVVFLSGGSVSIAEELCDGVLLIGVSRVALEGAARALPIILSGNDGYGGILTEEQYEERKKDNFCCRSCREATGSRLFYDICFLLDHACFCESIRLRIASLVRRDFSPISMAQDAKKAYYAALRIGIIGYYGFGNFGDESMLSAIHGILENQGIREIFPLYRRSDSESLSRTRILRAILALRKCDFVLFGGGNLLQNQTSVFSFFYYAVLLFLCKKQTIVGIGMGIGELNGYFYERICGRLLKRFSMIYTRTPADAHYARRLAPEISRKIRLSCDPCLFLPQSHGVSRRKKIIVIPKKAPDDAMLCFLERKKAEGYAILPLLLFPAQDRVAIEKFAAIGSSTPVLIQSPTDFYRESKDAMLCISERLHGAVFSLLSHTFCLLSADSQKNRAFAADIENTAKACGICAPVQCYYNANEAEEKEREAKGKTFGFSEIISVLTKRY